MMEAPWMCKYMTVALDITLVKDSYVIQESLKTQTLSLVHDGTLERQNI